MHDRVHDSYKGANLFSWPISYFWMMDLHGFVNVTKKASCSIVSPPIASPSKRLVGVAADRCLARILMYFGHPSG